MPATAPKPELMRSLGRLVRGLSALFWGLPVALVVCVQAVTTAWLDDLEPFGLLGPLLVTSLLFYGLWQMSGFQQQERVWMLALDRAKLLALVNAGLSPFLLWHRRVPEDPFFGAAVLLMMVSSLLFLLNLNLVLTRLTAMLPDETLRLETKTFTAVNSVLLVLIPMFLAISHTFLQMEQAGLEATFRARTLDTLSQWVLLLLVLLPTAITMSLIWRTKEVIVASVFGTE